MADDDTRAPVLVTATQDRYRVGPADPPRRRGYCLRTCYCGTCPHYVELPPLRPAPPPPWWHAAREAHERPP